MTTVDRATASVYEQFRPPEEAVKAPDDMGQGDFLRLMTTQLRNQDPFEPLENGQFLAQIAQFGTVSGIKELQDSFGNLSAALQSNRALQASVLVGKQVLVESDRAELVAEQGLDGAVELNAAVRDLKVQIHSPSGELVAEIALGAQPPGLVEFHWDGSLPEGGSAPAGTYSIAAGALAGDGAQAQPVLAAANINSVTLGQRPDELSLDVGALGSVSLSQVRQIS